MVSSSLLCEPGWRNIDHWHRPWNFSDAAWLSLHVHSSWCQRQGENGGGWKYPFVIPNVVKDCRLEKAVVLLHCTERSVIHLTGSQFGIVPKIGVISLHTSINSSCYDQGGTKARIHYPLEKVILFHENLWVMWQKYYRIYNSNKTLSLGNKSFLNVDYSIRSQCITICR